MFVVDEGAGPVVVFIPGLGADHSMYAPPTGALTEFRRIAVDLRGSGRSPSLAGVPVGDVLRVQADEVAGLLRERGIARAHLVGISYGGPVIETLMLRHPGLVASAIICDSLCDTRPRTATERVQMGAARLQPLALRALPRGVQAASMRWVYGRRWPLAAEMLARLFRTARIDDLVKQRRAVNAVRLEDELRECPIPTLCLVGDYSALAESMMRRLESVLLNSEFAIIADSFDPSSLCQPEAFTRHVREWVARQESEAGRPSSG